MADETEPLLSPSHTTSPSSNVPSDGVAFDRDQAGDANGGESFDKVPRSKRKLGVVSTAFLIFNRVIGTGIYATPSIILRFSGSVGVALIMWILGALVAAAGTAVCIELGTGLPRSGGEKNYLEYIYQRPKYLVTCIFSVYVVLTGTATANSIVFGEYILNALAFSPLPFSTRIVALLCLSSVLLIHSTFITFGIRLQNTLGFFKLCILSSIALFGILSLLGVKGFRVREGYERSRSFDSWRNIWQGSGIVGWYSFGTGMYNVIWSFIGYSTANSSLSETSNPIRTVKCAAPIAMGAVSVAYFAVNIGYFSVVAKKDMVDGRRIVAALFFRNLWGQGVERVLSLVIALSVLGNILSGQFAQGRVIQELGREGILPFSSFFASNKPFNAPFAGLFLQYLISCAFVIGVPYGDAYLFMINTSSYCTSLINTFVSLGLLLLYFSPTPRSFRVYGWNPPFKAYKPVIMAFFLTNVFLISVPLVPPKKGGKGVYEALPYWLHALISLSISLIGIGLCGRSGYLGGKAIDLREGGWYKKMELEGTSFGRYGVTSGKTMITDKNSEGLVCSSGAI